jgi:GMP synthase-like glutamine amidotransferase
MKVLAFQHYPTEPMGYIEDILRDRGIEFEYIKLYKEKIDRSKVEDATHLVFMGGPMGVYDDYQFLSEEKEIIKSVYRKKPVIGICLGAQLIASALGGRVYPYKKELGWFEVEKVFNDVVVNDLPEKMTVFQWHGDTFTLPEDSILLYRGHFVENQAFRAEKALALQFHLEVTEKIVRTWLEDENMKESEKRKILEDTEYYVDEANKLCEKLIDNFLRM